MADWRIFPDYAPPTSPGHHFLSDPEGRGPENVIGNKLFAVTEHFMSWVISQERNPMQHRDVLRNLERILQICSVARDGNFMTFLEETHAMGLLHNLTEGLDNGKEHWEDILPASELMLIQLERNPKSLIVSLLVQLRNAYHDRTERSDEVSQKLKTVSDFVMVRLTPEMSREQAMDISKRLELFLNQPSWGMQELEGLEQELIQMFTPPPGIKG